jgi:hypothetical protein
MSHPRFATSLIVTLIASLISFGMPWISVATVGRIPLAASAVVAAVAFIIAFSTTVVALFAHPRRRLWLVLAVIPALLWPVFAVSTVTACAFYVDCD